MTPEELAAFDKLQGTLEITNAHLARQESFSFAFMELMIFDSVAVFVLLVTIVFLLRSRHNAH